jgi:peroxiredoxin
MWWRWILLFILSSCQNFLGDASGIYKKLSECLVDNVICVVVTDNFVTTPETDDINLLENHNYAISCSGFKTLTLNMKKINVLGTFSFNSLKV